MLHHWCEVASASCGKVAITAVSHLYNAAELSHWQCVHCFIDIVCLHGKSNA